MTLDQIKTITSQIGTAMSMPINPANAGQLNLKINKLTLMLAAACYANATAEKLLTYKEYVTIQSLDYQDATALQQKLMLKRETRPEVFYYNLTTKQYDALLCTLHSLTSVLTTVKQQAKG